MLGWKLPQFAHLSLIHGLDGSKLSKRHGAVDVNEFKKLGYLPKAIIKPATRSSSPISLS